MKEIKRNFWNTLLISMIAVLFLLTGCAASNDDDDDDDSSNSVNITSSAAKALPAIPASASSGPSMAVGDPIGDTIISNFFKLECQMESDNNCPSGVTADANNKYTVTTLIGVIYHAEMYMENVLDNQISSCTAATVNAGSFVTTDAGGSTSTYLIDYFSQLNCIGSTSYNSQSQYYTVQSDTASDVVIIVTRKHDTATAGWDQSDIYQAYLSKDSAGAAHILAFNTTNINDAADDSTFRTVLLVNLATRKFLVQHHGTGTNYLIAAGQGGISASGTYESGYYFAKTNNTAGICIDNATQKEVAASLCSSETVAWTTPAEVATYLGMTAGEQTDLAGFISYFQDGPTAGQNATTALDAFPTAAADAKHIPNSIQ